MTILSYHGGATLKESFPHNEQQSKRIEFVGIELDLNFYGNPNDIGRT